MEFRYIAKPGKQAKKNILVGRETGKLHASSGDPTQIFYRKILASRHLFVLKKNILRLGLLSLRNHAKIKRTKVKSNDKAKRRRRSQVSSDVEAASFKHDLMTFPSFEQASRQSCIACCKMQRTVLNDLPFPQSPKQNGNFMKIVKAKSG